MWNPRPGYNGYGAEHPAPAAVMQNGYYGGGSGSVPPVSNVYHQPPASHPHHSAYQQRPQHQPPPQPPQQAHHPGFPPQGQYPPADPFRSYYAGRLRELTFNSRPIIQDLSLIAQTQRNENEWNNMAAIVDEIEQAILASAPHEKLPKLYLLDSISKNVGAPYTTQLLPPIIPRLYQRTYREVDGVTKAKMEEMIGLWRTGGPGRSELYGAQVREAVEHDIFGSAAFGRGPPPPTQDRVVAAMQAALAAHHRETTARPWDTLAMQNFQVLQALNDMLMSRPLSPQELQQIMDKLTAMTPKPAPVPMPTPPQQSFAPAPAVAAGGMAPAVGVPPFPPQIPGDGYRSTPPVQPQPPHLMQSGASTPPYPTSTPVLGDPAAGPAAPAPQVAIPIDVANILKSLTGAGLGSAPLTPDYTPAPLPRTKLDDYEDAILALDVNLTEMDLNKPRELPFDHLPEKCTQCHMRFPEKGPKLEAHMDWHFRRNKQERQSEGRGSHRRWLPKAEEWINDVSNADAGPSSALGGSAAAKGAGSEGSKPRMSVEQLQKRWVPVPSGPIKKARPCGICKEPFKDEWEEKEEIWIWKNAIEVDGKYYHATCRAELLENRRLAKLKAEGEGRSMSKSKSPGASSPAPPDVKREALPLGTSALGVQDEDTISANGGKRKAETGEEGSVPDTGDIKRTKVEQTESAPVDGDSAMEGQSDANPPPDDSGPQVMVAVQPAEGQSDEKADMTAQQSVPAAEPSPAQV